MSTATRLEFDRVKLGHHDVLDARGNVIGELRWTLLGGWRFTSAYLGGGYNPLDAASEARAIASLGLNGEQWWEFANARRELRGAYAYMLRRLEADVLAEGRAMAEAGRVPRQAKRGKNHEQRH
ncbi:MAG: hypothetical protein OXC05_08350 [Halieaceae bacterium]|nr:hypothetical protein [Halieaceae bacterium]